VLPLIGKRQRGFLRAEEKRIALDYKGIPNARVTASPLLKNAFSKLMENSVKHADCKRIRSP